MEEYINIGSTQKTHGTTGEIKVKVEDHFLEDFVKAPAVFLSIKGKQVPYFLEAIRGNDPLIVKFEEVDSKEAAKKLVNILLFLRKSDVQDTVVASSEDLDQYERYIGFEMREKEQGLIGPIQDIVEMPQQILAVLTYRGKEIYIPLNEQFIKEVKKEENIIIVELPEGLLDL